MQKINKISYSEFKSWKECPYRHKLIYIDELPYYSSNEYTAFGTAIHEMCEKYIPLPDQVDPIKTFEESFSNQIELLKKESIKINESLISEMKNQHQNICNEIYSEVKNQFGNFEVVSVEEELMEEITEFECSGKKFKGFIDMVLKTSDGKYHIIDWKTCSWGWNAKKKNDPLTNYQLTFYKNYFSKKHKIPKDKIETYFVLLKRTAKKENVEIVRVTSGPKKTENALKNLEIAVININKKNYVKNRLNCKYCKFYKTENCK